MMGLVDYDSSSDSEVDTKELHGIQNKETESTNPQNLFANLPTPKQNINVIEEVSDEFLNKKAEVSEKPPKRIRIGVPELSSIEEDDIDIVPAKKIKSKSALFSILPQPKIVPLSNTCFVPKSLQKKIKSKKLSPRAAKPSQTLKASTVLEVKTRKPVVSDSESDNEETSSIVPTVIDDQTWNELFLKKRRIAVAKVKKPVVPVPVSEQSGIELAPIAEKPYSGLDNQAFKELLGSVKKPVNINMIDIEEAKIHPDREEWLKSLTDPTFEASPEIKAPVNKTSLFKNHITSLAERALTNDKDLQMRWAESRHSRNVTRVKYGF